MRVVCDIPHPKYKIQIFSYNAKYIVKIELGQFEQVYKINESDVMGLNDVKAMVTDQLLKNSVHRFVEMRDDWEDAFKNKNENDKESIKNFK
jgi:hypothetical protein